MDKSERSIAMQNDPYRHMTNPDDGTKIYFPSGQHYTLGEFLAQINPETKSSDDGSDTNTVG